MKLVVGLGNPGRKYQATRHNIGYEVLGNLARRFANGPAKSAFQGEVADAELGGQRALLLWPHTFMNRSGASVVLARDFYKLENSELLVVCDDFNLPLARLRARSKGSSGGQKGLEDIIRALGTDELARLRVGIGSPPEGWDPVNYVLGNFGKDEREEVELAVVRAADAVVVWAREGIGPCMNQYNV
ncbi:MAG TPA: aminoacyl-tRNA hydrolase [Pirellulales bacterium]|nr:aminoacyl-tRNA hydrolase [Pirellulales bacterium]